MTLQISTITNNVYPTADLFTQLQTMIPAGNSAWSFVERVTGTGTYPNQHIADIYKCSGASNSFGQDFYVGFVRLGEAGNIGVIMSEQYSTTTHLMSNIAPFIGNNATYTLPSDGSYTTARNPADANSLVINTTGFVAAPGTPATGSTATYSCQPVDGQLFFLSVTKDRIVFTLEGTVMCIYAGLYDSNYSTALDPFPLVVGNIHPYTNSQGLQVVTYQAYGACFYTREVGPTGAGLAYAYAGCVDGPLLAAPGNAVSSAAVNKARDPISGMFPFSRLRLTSISRRAVQRGLLKADVMQMNAPELSVGVGDTITVGGVGYTCMQVDEVGTPWSVAYGSSRWVATAA